MTSRLFLCAALGTVVDSYGQSQPATIGPQPPAPVMPRIPLSPAALERYAIIPSSKPVGALYISASAHCFAQRAAVNGPVGLTPATTLREAKATILLAGSASRLFH